VPGTKKIKAALEACPNWTDLPAKDSQTNYPFSLFTPNSTKQIMRTMEDLALNDLNSLGEVLKEYVEDKRKMDPHAFDIPEKLYLINRYVFDVPAEQVWPLSYSRDGKLELTGEFDYWLGPRIDPVDEFYYFWKLYGRRPGTAPPGHEDTLPEGGIPNKGWVDLTGWGDQTERGQNGDILK